MDDIMDDAETQGMPQEKPVNKDPEFLQNMFSGAFLFLQSYGWYVVIILMALYYVKGKLEKWFKKWNSARNEDVDLHRYDDSTILRRQQAMEESRRRMQEKLDAQAAEYAEQQKKKEEEKRKLKLEDWDRHVAGNGYRSKYRPPPEENAATAHPSGTSSSQSKKKVYRADEFNPLAGGSGGSSSYYRPDRRRGNTGG